jgi:hypothetical protein
MTGVVVAGIGAVVCSSVCAISAQHNGLDLFAAPVTAALSMKRGARARQQEECAVVNGGEVDE